MKLKLVVLVMLTFFIQESNSQVFKPDWEFFSSDKYAIEFKENSTTYASLDNIGELHFVSKKDATKFIVYFVFNTEKINKEFEDGDYEEQRLSCIHLRPTDFAYFLYQKYYYLMSPWQNCENTNDLLFTDLPKEIYNYISVKR